MVSMRISITYQLDNLIMQLRFEGMKMKITIDKETFTLIINKPDMDDAGKYTCEANGVQTSALLYVDG